MSRFNHLADKFIRQVEEEIDDIRKFNRQLRRLRRIRFWLTVVVFVVSTAVALFLIWK